MKDKSEIREDLILDDVPEENVSSRQCILNNAYF